MLEMFFLPWDKPRCELNAGTEYAQLQLLVTSQCFLHLFVCLDLFNLCVCVCVPVCLYTMCVQVSSGTRRC